MLHLSIRVVNDGHPLSSSGVHLHNSLTIHSVACKAKKKKKRSHLVRTVMVCIMLTDHRSTEKSAGGGILKIQLGCDVSILL